MRRLSIILLLGFLATFFVQQQVLAQAEKPKPEDVLRKMSDYLGKPACVQLPHGGHARHQGPRTKIPCNRSRR